MSSQRLPRQRTAAVIAGAGAGYHTGGVIQGTTDSLSPEELALLESDQPASVHVDVETGNITSVTPINGN